MQILDKDNIWKNTLHFLNKGVTDWGGGIQTYMPKITDIIFGVVYPAHDSSVFVGKTQNWYSLKEGFG